MSDDELERELAGLSPAGPPAPLLARLESSPPQRRTIVRFPFWVSAAAAAACVAAFFAIRDQVPGPVAEPSVAYAETFHPVETDQFLVSAQDLGVVELQPGQPYRLVHCVWADRESFASDRGQSRLEVRQAREQIVPVALEIL